MTIAPYIAYRIYNGLQHEDKATTYLLVGRVVLESYSTSVD